MAYSHFNLDHWLKVKAERHRQGIVDKTARGEQVAHALTGKRIVDKTTNKTYVVEQVKKDWLQGWFLTALMECNGSHRVCVVDSLSCADESIQRAANFFNDSFQLPQ